MEIAMALEFYNEDNDWFCNAGLPSDLTIFIDGVNFHLHKFPLLSRCGKIEKLMKEAQNNNKGTSTIILEEIPGGATSFLVASNFCYGVHIELTPTNIVMVYHMSDYLEMTDEYGNDNLFSKTETYIHKNILTNWKDCMVALQSCETIVTKSDNLQIISKCLNAIPGGSILWNGIDTGARIQTSESDWWFEDVSHLSVVLFKRLIKTVESKGIQPKKLTGAIMYYSGKCLHGLGRWQSGQFSKTKFNTKYDIVDQRVVLESIVDLLPQIKGKSFCRYLLGLLCVGFMFVPLGTVRKRELWYGLPDVPISKGCMFFVKEERSRFVIVQQLLNW
ncbi:unnamed protein product [Lactuca virosa]|uniref:BTB domain-containing protein n=1 Tax=Lactuca virosa TaxID=75947 RepID=A0AAU9NJ38_9ASTR|nr:unnamed protein product [Lactuca virosa]